MAGPKVRSSVKNNLRVPAIDSRNLSLSGIVLGVAPGPGQELFSRENVALLPRPSLEFGLDELIEAFVEVYNLGAPKTGRREYEVRVTVKLVEEDRGQIGKLMKQFRLLGQERSAEMTLRFERTAAGLDGTVVEHFTIDSSELIPGAYKLLIEIRDRHSGKRATAERNFTLAK